MNYSIKAVSKAADNAIIHVKQSEIGFGTTERTSETLPNPAELFLGSFAACILKNVERFSGLIRFSYEKSELTVNVERIENSPRMDYINYELTIYTQDEKFGTMYNTIKQVCTITSNIRVHKNV